MTAPKFSPWPWRFEMNGLSHASVISQVGWLVCENVLHPNANLIATAPEMYAKLAHLSGWMDAVEGMSRNNLEHLALEERSEIEALLAKARGEPSA